MALTPSEDIEAEYINPGSSRMALTDIGRFAWSSWQSCYHIDGWSSFGALGNKLLYACRPCVLMDAH